MPVMAFYASALLLSLALPLLAAAQSTLTKPAASERIGIVNFANSCAPSQQASFNRAVALLHDFTYQEAQSQFERIAQADPACAMAHWGIAMTQFHQIWNRPDEKATTLGWSELEKAESPAAKTDREREYIAALRNFYRPGNQEYLARVDAYSLAMDQLFSHYPNDVDAGAFYALSLLADEPPSDTSLAHEQQALLVLNRLSAKYPEHPGVAHYTIHACDNPALALKGLNAARRYGEIAPDTAHSAHMPSHIFARLGMWQEDIHSNLNAVAAGQRALENHQSSGFDQLHSYDFLLYAYLQSGQDTPARQILQNSSSLLTHMESMPEMGGGMDMSVMLPMYRSKLPIFYNLEMRNWNAAAALQPAPDTPPIIATLIYWARIIADGHLHQSQAAQADLARYDALIREVKQSKDAFMLDSTGSKIEEDEVAAWTALAEGNNDKALSTMRKAADLQDKVGQSEVDIPAREMLADMLLDLHRPQEALAEYDTALKMSPNRFNALYNAGSAAEMIGDKEKATKYYSALLKNTDNGAHSERVEFARVKTFLSSTQAMLR